MKAPDRTFGAYVRRHRNAAGLSLRVVAEALGVSHVYLGEIERGVRAMNRAAYWRALVDLIPTMSIEELKELAESAKPVQLSLKDAPPEYRDLGMALARRLERRDLGDLEISRLLDILKGGDD